MSEDYVWDKTGAATPDLLALEHNLSTLRHSRPLGPLPLRSSISGGVSIGWIRPMTLGAVLSAGLTLLLIWAFVRVGEATPPAAMPVMAPPPVAAPPEDRPSTVPDAEIPQSELEAKPEPEPKRKPELEAQPEPKRKRKPTTAPKSKSKRKPKRKPKAAPQPQADSQMPFASNDIDCTLDPSKCDEPAEGSLPETLTSGDIKAAVAPWKAEARACGPKHGGLAGERISVKLAIEGATGKVRANATGSNLNTPLGRCVAAVLSKAIFPRFRKASIGVLYPIRL